MEFFKRFETEIYSRIAELSAYVGSKVVTLKNDLESKFQDFITDITSALQSQTDLLKKLMMNNSGGEIFTTEMTLGSSPPTNQWTKIMTISPGVTDKNCFYKAGVKISTIPGASPFLYITISSGTVSPSNLGQVGNAPCVICNGNITGLPSPNNFIKPLTMVNFSGTLTPDVCFCELDLSESKIGVDGISIWVFPVSSSFTIYSGFMQYQAESEFTPS